MPHPCPSIQLAWKCPSCTVRTLIPSRSFTAISSRSQVLPESPRFIDIPEPPQKNLTPKPRIKGLLPVPRDIFHRRRGGVEKVTPEYLSVTTKDAKPPGAPPRFEADRIHMENKLRMTERRKQNLREGLMELQARRRKRDEFVGRRSQERTAYRQQLFNTPQREDERLTNPTTTMLKHSIQKSAALPDPDRESRIARMKLNVAAKEAQRVSDRQDALHTLYMHARTFITTEAQLDERIEAAFGTESAPPVEFRNGSSIWWKGMPESVQDKLDSANKKGNTVEESDGFANRTKERIRRIAEQLTGGKMDE